MCTEWWLDAPVCCKRIITTQALAHSFITTHTYHDSMWKTVKWLSRVRLFTTPWTIAYQAPPSMEFSRQEYQSGLPCPSSIVWEANELCLRSWQLSKTIMLLLLAAAAASLLSCLNLCNPVDGSPLGTPVPVVLQARTLQWVAISFSKAWKGKGEGKSLSRVQLCVTPWTVPHQDPLSTGFSRQEDWSGLPLSSLNIRIQ